MTKLAHSLDPTHPDHHHHLHAYERLERAEGWMTRIAVAIGLAMGAAMAVGLLTATGHVTW